jgi:carbonic anhydrase
MKNRLCAIALICILTTYCISLIAAEEGTSLNALQALNFLKEGNARFVTSKFEHPNLTPEHRVETTINGQKPFVSILACSDSRVPVELIFDRGIGDIFTVRVAGNIANDTNIGSLEYGVEHLHTPLLVIMGHTKCGAVAAAVDGAKVEGKLKTIIKKIEPAVKKAKKAHFDSKEDLLQHAINENIRLTYKNIMNNSQAIRFEAQKGNLMIIGALYDLETGKIEWFEIK